MKPARVVFLVSLLALSACRGGDVLKCNDQVAYKRAVATPHVKAPEGLDDLDALKEIPLPEASPQAAGTGPQGCLDAPPLVTGN